MGIEMGSGPIFTRDCCMVIYDGECRFCVKSKEGIERLSRSDQPASVRFIPYQSRDAEKALGSGYRLGRPDVAYLIGADGQIRQGLDAILPLLPGLPGGRLLGSLSYDACSQADCQPAVRVRRPQSLSLVRRRASQAAVNSRPASFVTKTKPTFHYETNF